jgi:hypothetical protein
MPIASSLTHESRFMALFVGPKHSGKTVAACSWLSEDPKKRIKVLDNDGRIKGILGASWIQKDRIDFDVFPPRVPGQEKTFFERVNNDLDLLLSEVVGRKSPYETYVCDSLTAFCKNLILDAIPLTHADKRGKKIGIMEMAGPADYGFESTGTDSYLSFLRSLPINIIVTAHVIDKYDKPLITDDRGRTYKDVYAESVVVGEKLSLRDKIAANVSLYFDHIFRFDRQMIQGKEHFFVEYVNDIACTSFPNLKPGKFDITDKNFKDFTLNLINTSTNNLSSGK